MPASVSRILPPVTCVMRRSRPRSVPVGRNSSHAQLAAERIGLDAHARVVRAARQISPELSEQALGSVPARPGQAPAILVVAGERRTATDARGPRGEDRIAFGATQVHLRAALRQ